MGYYSLTSDLHEFSLNTFVFVGIFADYEGCNSPILDSFVGVCDDAVHCI